MYSFAIEILAFLRARKKLWMLPMIFMMAVVGGLVVLTQGSAVAPFIYTFSRTDASNAILGLSAFYHDSAAALVATAGSWQPHRRSASPARSTTRFPASAGLLPRRGRPEAVRGRSHRLLR